MATTPLADRIPVLKQLRQSVGLQRGMLIAGLVLCGVFLLAAAFAPLIAPYGYAQLSSDAGGFAPRQAPSTSGARRSPGTTSSRASSGDPAPRSSSSSSRWR